MAIHLAMSYMNVKYTIS